MPCTSPLTASYRGFVINERSDQLRHEKHSKYTSPARLGHPIAPQLLAHVPSDTEGDLFMFCPPPLFCDRTAGRWWERRGYGWERGAMTKGVRVENTGGAGLNGPPSGLGFLTCMSPSPDGGYSWKRSRDDFFLRRSILISHVIRSSSSCRLRCSLYRSLSTPHSFIQSFIVIEPSPSSRSSESAVRHSHMVHHRHTVRLYRYPSVFWHSSADTEVYLFIYHDAQTIVR